MNKFLLLCVLSFAFAFPAAAQTAEVDNTNGVSHLIFKGIPIDGGAKSFADKLVQKGFTKDPESEDILKGNFANKECIIYLVTSTITKTIWKVSVFTERKYTSWSSIKSDYNELKDLYTAKYGKPYKEFSFFLSPYEEGDGYELTGLKTDKCRYSTYWNTKEGYIAISMSSSCRISIGYEDRINSDLDDRESKQKALEDI